MGFVLTEPLMPQINGVLGLFTWMIPIVPVFWDGIIVLIILIAVLSSDHERMLTTTLTALVVGVFASFFFTLIGWSAMDYFIWTSAGLGIVAVIGTLYAFHIRGG